MKDFDYHVILLNQRTVSVLRARKSGFTLVEIIFALFIYSIGLVIIAASITAGLRSLSHTAQVEECRSRAREFIENVKSAPPAGSMLPLADQWQEDIGNKQCDVKKEVYSDDGGLVVVITIGWKECGSPVILSELIED